MAQEVTPLYDIIIILIGGVIVITIIFFFLYCNYLGGICPGKWACKFLGQIIYDATPSLIGKAVIGGLIKLCDFVPL